VCRRLGGTKGARYEQEIISFSVKKKMKTINLEQDFFKNLRMVSAGKRVEFVTDRMSYIVLRGRWCNIIVLNVDAPNEEKNDDSKHTGCST